MTDVQVCLVTAPDEEAALSLAKRLVEEKLCACANLVSGGPVDLSLAGPSRGRRRGVADH